MIWTILLAVQVQAASSGVMPLGPDEEVQMALAAAPEHLRGGAGVYRLASRQFEQVRPSQNGFNCMVAREPSMGLAPVCYDAEGSRSNMQADMFRSAMRHEGKSEAQIEAAAAEAYKVGGLKAPSRPGIAYMLSNHFTQVDAKSGERECIFPPHVMFYAPYLKNSDIGADKRHFGSIHHPWILNEGEPGAHILVVAHGADPAACR